MKKNIVLKLEKRINRIIKNLNEKSASRSHTPSKSFLVWKFLSDRNGANRDVIKASFPEADQASISSVLLDCLEQNIITQVGDMYFANKNYEWDDIGVYDNMDQKDIIDDLQYLLQRVSK